MLVARYWLNNLDIYFKVLMEMGKGMGLKEQALPLLDMEVTFNLVACTLGEDVDHQYFQNHLVVGNWLEVVMDCIKVPGFLAYQLFSHPFDATD